MASDKLLSWRVFAVAAIMLGTVNLPRAWGLRSIFDDPENWPASPQPMPAPAPAPSPTPTPAPAPSPTEPEPAPRPEPSPPHPGPAVAPASAPAAPRTPAIRREAPDRAARAQVLKIVKNVFSAEYLARTPAAKRQLAEELENEAAKIESNFTARYVLLDEAETASLGAGDITLLRRAIEGLDESFAIDGVGVVVDALTKLNELAPQDPAVIDWALDCVDARLGQDDFAGAHRLMAKLPATRVFKFKDAALRARWRAASEALAEGERSKAAFERLKTDPTDGAANFAAGRYLCLARHDWDKGLTYLARCADAKIKSAAAADLASPAGTSARYALAGQWWDIASDNLHGTFKSLAKERAVHWYNLIDSDLDGLQKVVADRRIAEAARGS